MEPLYMACEKEDAIIWYYFWPFLSWWCRIITPTVNNCLCGCASLLLLVWKSNKCLNQKCDQRCFNVVCFLFHFIALSTSPIFSGEKKKRYERVFPFFREYFVRVFFSFLPLPPVISQAIKRMMEVSLSHSFFRPLKIFTRILHMQHKIEKSVVSAVVL